MQLQHEICAPNNVIPDPCKPKWKSKLRMHKDDTISFLIAVCITAAPLWRIMHEIQGKITHLPWNRYDFIMPLMAGIYLRDSV